MDAKDEAVRQMKILQLNIQSNAKRTKAVQEFFAEVGETVKAFNDYGRQLEETKKHKLNKYFDDIQLYILSLNDITATCEFLLGEKRKVNAKIIDSKIRKDGYDTAYYEYMLNNILEPLLKHWQDELDFQKNNPPLKQKEITPIIDTTPKQTEKTSNQESIKTIPGLPDGFSQIECNATKEEILHYFMILTKERNFSNQEFFMTEEHVIEFVHKNFSVFNSKPSGKYFPINLGGKQKAILRHFIYRFYSKYDQVNSKEKYAKLLKHNFELFKEDDLVNTMSNMSESKKPIKGTIPVSIYLQK